MKKKKPPRGSQKKQAAQGEKITALFDAFCFDRLGNRGFGIGAEGIHIQLLPVKDVGPGVLGLEPSSGCRSRARACKFLFHAWLNALEREGRGGRVAGENILAHEEDSSTSEEAYDDVNADLSILEGLAAEGHGRGRLVCGRHVARNRALGRNRERVGRTRQTRRLCVCVFFSLSRGKTTGRHT